MRPASDAFATAMRESHTIATRIEVLVDGEPSGEPIDTALDGAVTLDATAQTRGRLALSVIDDGSVIDGGTLAPTSASSLLAPYGNELRVSRGVLLPDGTTELIRVGVFRLNVVDIDDGVDGLRVTIASPDRSARIIDARFEEPYLVAAGTNYTAAILAVLQDGWPEIPHDFTATTRTTPQLVGEALGDRWAFAQEMAKSIGMTLYFDGDGVCILRPVSSAGVAVDLAEGEGGVLLRAGRRWSREGAFNKVIATGENTGEGTPARGEAVDDNPLSPTYYFGSFGRVPRGYSSQFIATDEQADDAAAGILARELGTTQQLDFGTIVDPRLEPDDVVRVTRQRAGIVAENNVIDQLTIPLSAQAAMSGRTRATQIA